MGGDDLEDDYVPDELVAVDDDEGYSEIAADALHLLSDEEGQENHAPIIEQQTELERIQRKRKRRAKEKERKKIKLAEEAVTASSIAALSPLKLAEYLTSMQQRTFSTMSQIELDDLRITDSSIADTTTWAGSRTLDELPDFIAEVLPTLHKRLSQRSQSNGAPTLIFLTGAALRVADVTRTLKNKKLRGEKGGDVAKLFARHFKVEEHVEFLKRTKVGAAVGTAGRIGKLLCDTDAFTLSALTHIILDVTFRDAKDRSLLDIPEVRDEVFKTVLGCPMVIEAIKTGKVQVVLF